MSRGKGTGSVHYDEPRKRWKATIEAGYTVRGTRRRITVTAKTERDVLVRLKAKEREILATGVPPEGADPRKTVRSFADGWIADQERRLRPSAFVATRSQVTRWVIPQIGQMRLNRVTARDVEGVSNAMISAGRAKSSATRCHRELLRMLKDAKRGGHAVTASALLAKGPGLGERTRDAIPLDEVAAILASARSQPDGARWIIAFLLGLRPGEALGLTWSAVDWKRKILKVEWQLQSLSYKEKRNPAKGLRVPDGYEYRQLVGRHCLVALKSKSGSRNPPMTPLIEEALRAWQTQCPASEFDLVFPDENGLPRDDKEDRDAFRRLLREAGVSHAKNSEARLYTLYEARHTAATMLRANKTDDETLISILGHASILSSKTYLHSDDDRRRSALNGVEQQVRSQLSASP